MNTLLCKYVGLKSFINSACLCILLHSQRCIVLNGYVRIVVQRMDLLVSTEL